jgi:hypothetical protein
MHIIPALLAREKITDERFELFNGKISHKQLPSQRNGYYVIA